MSRFAMGRALPPIIALMLLCASVWADEVVSEPPPPQETAAAAGDKSATAPEESLVTVSAHKAAEIRKMTCRTVTVTGSRLRKREICSTPASVDGSKELLLEQQRRAAIDASIILNGGN